MVEHIEASLCQVVRDYILDASAFRALAGNRAPLRVVAAYAATTLTEYAAWIAMRRSPLDS